MYVYIKKNILQIIKHRIKILKPLDEKTSK